MNGIKNQQNKEIYAHRAILGGAMNMEKEQTRIIVKHLNGIKRQQNRERHVHKRIWAGVMNTEKE